MKLLISLCTLALLATAPSLAQEGNPGGKEMDNANAVDRVFAAAITQGGTAEVKLGEMAKDAARSKAVKDFASRMVKDHSEANDTFADIAKKAELPLPKELDPEHQAIAKKLKSADGKSFDLEYMKVQIGDHQKTALLLEHEIGSGQNAVVKAFAVDVLPTVLSHLAMAKDVMAELTGQATR